MKKGDSRVFQKKIWDFYTKEGRHDLPWRKTHNPYAIFVSEVMLQQTQVDRVVPKYRAFLKVFPNVRVLASAELRDVLALWSGLGYNRRALYLKRAAEAIVSKHKGIFPKDPEVLETLPGVGPYTARAIATFSHDVPYIFIETNIRRVFLSEFFPRSTKVPDAKLFPLIEAMLPKDISVREWYWALMDYGSSLTSTKKNPNKRSAHYVKQSTFAGSVREVRGAMLRELTGKRSLSKKKLLAPYSGKDVIRAQGALAGLARDGLVAISPEGYVTIE